MWLKNMARRRLFWLACAVTLVLALILMLGYWYVEDVNAKLPACDLYRAYSSISFDELTAAAQAAPELTVSARASVYGYAQTDAGGGYAAADVVFTDGNYSEINSFTMISGAYFATPDYQTDTNVAVISDKLAVRLFMSSDAVGRTFLLSGAEYTVCGVYRSDNSLTYQFASNGREQVYVPYTSSLAAAGQGADYIYVTDLSNPAISDAEGEALLDGSLGGRLSSMCTLTSFYENRTILAQQGRLLLFIPGMALVAVLAFVIWDLLAEVYTRWRGRTHDNTPGRRFILLRAVAAIACAVAAAGVFMLTSFDLYIPSFIPPGQVFSPGFYLNYAVGQAQAVNAGTVYLAVFNMNRLAFCVTLAILPAILILAACVSVMIGKLYKDMRRNEDE